MYHPKGDPENPLTGDELRGKFLMLATKAVVQARAEEIADAVAHLDALGDTSHLARLMACDERRRKARRGTLGPGGERTTGEE